MPIGSWYFRLYTPGVYREHSVERAKLDQIGELDSTVLNQFDSGSVLESTRLGLNKSPNSAELLTVRPRQSKVIWCQNPGEKRPENHGKSLSPHTNQYKNHQSRALSALSLSKVFSIIILLWSIDFWAPRASFSICLHSHSKSCVHGGPNALRGVTSSFLSSKGRVAAQ